MFTFNAQQVFIATNSFIRLVPLCRFYSVRLFIFLFVYLSALMIGIQSQPIDHFVPRNEGII